MSISQIVGLALIITLFIIIIRQQKPVLAVLLSIVFAVFIFLSMMDKLSSILNVMQELTRRTQVNYYFLATLLKILGVAYLGEFASVICQDAGEQAIAKKIEFSSKIIIAVLALPIVVAILESLIQLMPD